MLRIIVTLMAAASVLVGSGVSAETRRDYMMIVGSTTVYPFSELVVERFVDESGFKTPMVQPTGSGGGLSLFCNGSDELDPDITYASRPIRRSELDKCRKNGVNDVVEIKIGYDGIVLAQSADAESLSVSRRDIYLALAELVPNPGDGETFIANPHQTWKDVNASLPATPIEFWGPSRGSGTRYTFARLAMEEGCRTLDGMIEQEQEDPWQYRSVCRTFRDDQVNLKVSENDELNVEALKANTNALAIVSYGILEANSDRIRGLAIDGIPPDFQTISNNSYLISRPLYLYVKKSSAELYPGLREFVAEFTSDEAWGEAGYLRTEGLIPMSADERKKYAEVAITLTPMGM
ncbi:MAG: substrate-binding domain-containing protein [Gammaproteobacteria bacterium]|nr:MAG: substrate-binding domain-containing protein [Gammaproteobacteria bacterium]